MRRMIGLVEDRKPGPGGEGALCGGGRGVKRGAEGGGKGAGGVRGQNHARAVWRGHVRRRWRRGPASTGEAGEASLRRVASGSDGPGGGGEVEVDEDGANHGWLGDVGEDAAATAAPGAGEDVELEGAPEKLGPGDAPVPGGGKKGEQEEEGGEAVEAEKDGSREAEVAVEGRGSACASGATTSDRVAHQGTSGPPAVGPVAEADVRGGRLRVRPLRRLPSNSGLRLHRQPPASSITFAFRPACFLWPAPRTLHSSSCTPDAPGSAPGHPAAVLAPRRACRGLASPPPSGTTGPLKRTMTRLSAAVPPSSTPRLAHPASEKGLLLSLNRSLSGC